MGWVAVAVVLYAVVLVIGTAILDRQERRRLEHLPGLEHLPAAWREALQIYTRHEAEVWAARYPELAGAVLEALESEAKR